LHASSRRRPSPRRLPLRGRRSKRDVRLKLEDWEFELIEKAAWDFSKTDRDDLKSELIKSLLALKESRPAGILDWKSYVAKATYNRANNVTRGWRRFQKRAARMAVTEVMHTPPADPAEDRLALAQAWAELKPEFRRLWEVLAEEGGRKIRAARRLGLHPNTLRLRIRKIQRVLERHGFRGRNAGRIPPNTVTGDFPREVLPRARHSTRVKRDFEALEKRRFDAVTLVAQGLNQSQVARRLKVARQSVNRWLKRYRESGKAALAKAGRAGRQPRLSGEQKERLIQWLVTEPCPGGPKRPRWTCPRVARLIEEKFGVRYHPGHVWKLLRKLGSKGERPR
jgi:transposase